MTRVVFLFLDGVGLGDDDQGINPLAAAVTPALDSLLGGKKLVASSGAIVASQASMMPTDAAMGVPGRPQSASGQAALLTGVNAPVLIGEHYGPRPEKQLRQLLEGETLFTQVLKAGGTAAFVNAYPSGYFEAVERGRRLHGAIPYAADAAGLELATSKDLMAGRALSVDFTNAGWRDSLGYDRMPLRTPAEAGQILARLSADHDLVFFDQWLTDILGHRRDLAGATTLFEQFDSFLGGLLEAIDGAQTLVVISSDHGNVEDCSRKRHTENLVPTVLVGPGHARLSREITDLTNIAPLLLSQLAAGGSDAARRRP
ncbi:MAG: metalloenzyme domain-containing protein [Chloroflexota bacterium]|nr:metalloenzyme domain-containing protein [Chloroflexota bacterium]